MTTSTVHEVHLENFEGPIDLLLFLIKKDDLDIYDIPIAKITEEYLATLELMRELNLEVAGDFLVLAATLMQIKARALLPSPPDAEEGGPDPRAELIEKLLEYQKFKGVAADLGARAESFKDVFYRGAPVFSDEEKSLDLSLFDLLAAVREALTHAEFETATLEGETFPIEEKMEKILFLLERSPHITLREIFADERFRRAILACFLAMLELIKAGKISARQVEICGEIRIFKRDAQPGEESRIENRESSEGTPDA